MSNTDLELQEAKFRTDVYLMSKQAAREAIKEMLLVPAAGLAAFIAVLAFWISVLL